MKKIKLVAFSFIFGFTFLNHSWRQIKSLPPQPREFLDALNIARDLKQNMIILK